jgi:Gpi18-like mannosyltransferase
VAYDTRRDPDVDAAEVNNAAAEPAVPTPPDEPEPRSPWRPAIVTAFSVWGAASLAYFLVNLLTWMTRSEAGPQVSGFIEVWNQWDAGHYVTIAMFGYNPLTENTAFFPGYPLLIRFFEPVLPGGGLSASLIISHAACVASLAVLYRLTDELMGDANARRTVYYLMAFPFAFFLVAPYNESTFLFFTVASLYCMRRGYWVSAGLFAAAASATRQAGVLLALAFAIEYLRQRGWRPSRIRWNALAVLLVPTGMLAYAFYLWRAMGDPLKFVHIQAVWGRKPTWPWEGTGRALGVIQRASVDGYIFQPNVVLNVIDVLAVVVTLLLVGLSLFGPWRLGLESLYITVFCAVSFLVVLISPIGIDVPLHGVPRYVLEMIPAFMVLAKIGRNPHLERFYLVPAMAVQGVLVLGFYYDLWLA